MLPHPPQNRAVAKCTLSPHAQVRCTAAGPDDVDDEAAPAGGNKADAGASHQQRVDSSPPKLLRNRICDVLAGPSIHGHAPSATRPSATLTCGKAPSSSSNGSDDPLCGPVLDILTTLVDLQKDSMQPEYLALHSYSGHTPSSGLHIFASSLQQRRHSSSGADTTVVVAFQPMGRCRTVYAAEEEKRVRAE